MKKICFLLGHYFKYSKGGAELQASLIANELIKKYEIHYIFIRPKNLKKNSILKNDNNIHLYTLKNYDYKIFGKFHFLNFNELNKLLYIINPDYIYQRGDRAHLGIAANWCKKNNKKLILGISMDYNCYKKEIFNLKTNFLSYPCNIINGFFTLNGIQSTDIIIAQTNYQKHLLKKNFNKDSKIIYNGIPTPNPPFIKENPPIISWIANIKKLKRPEIFVKLAKEFENINVKFIFAGRPSTGTYQNNIEEKSKKLSNLTYLGEISLQETNELLSKSSLLINTSITEGFSNTYLQAWMRETPVVTLNCDPDAIIKKNEIGYHSKTFERLVKDVKYLIENDKIRKEMGMKARKYVINNHDIKKMGKEYYKILEGL